jgi:tetratricopeptide (TPR) repeat protein
MNRGSDSASHWEYVDFDLEIGEEREARKYPVSVRSPEGEAQEEMSFPFDEWELRDKLKDVEVALLRSGGKRRRIGTPEEQAIQGFGRALFEALLVGDVGAHYRVSWREARRQNKGLRIKLRVRPPELSALPWEFLYDPKRDYLSLSSRTPLVRYPEVPQPIERLTVTPPLRILGMVASPQGLPQLDEGHEKRLVEEATKRLQARGLVELAWLEGQTWRDLQRSMRGGPWHIFHFIGHGGFDPETEEGAIALSSEEGRKHLLGAADLALLLDDHYFLRLAFLNSCEGARGSPRDAFSSTAATLVRSGIPAVVAMQYEITDNAAIEFSRSFYEALADGLPVDAVVAEARTAIKMGSALEWGTPVLYMRSEDGLIFDIPPEGSRTEATEAVEKVEDQDVLRRYRESVESGWTGGELDRRQAERLRELADELGLNLGGAGDIEREVMGDTKEAIIERQEVAAREEERNTQLEALYTQARRLHRDRRWQAVIDVFEQIRAKDPAFHDREGLLTSAREALEADKLAGKLAAIYQEGLRHMEAGEWRQALRSFEEVRQLEPGYRDVNTLLAQARDEASHRTPPTTPPTQETEGGEQRSAQHSILGFIRTFIREPTNQELPAFPAPNRRAWYLTTALSSLLGVTLFVAVLATSGKVIGLAGLGVAGSVYAYVATTIVAYKRPIDWKFANAFTLLAHIPLAISLFPVYMAEFKIENVATPEIGAIASSAGAAVIFGAIPNILIVSIISRWRRLKRPHTNA